MSQCKPQAFLLQLLHVLSDKQAYRRTAKRMCWMGFAYRFTFRQVPYKFEVLVLKRSISILRSFRVVFLYVSEAKVAFFIPTHLPPSFGY